MKKRFLAIILTLVVCSSLTACSKYNQEAVDLRDAGVTAMESGDYTTAIDDFNQALGLSMGTVTDLEIDINYYKAAAQYKAGLTDDAISTYTALIKYDKGNYKAYFLRGSVYANEAELDSALKDYDKAIACDSTNYMLYIQIYENLSALGFSDQASTYLTKALDVSDSSAEATYYKGRIYYLQGDSDQATTYLTEAKDKGVDDAKLYLAKIYQDQGDMTSAQSLLEEYAASDSVTSEALGTLGDIEMASGNYENALSYYQTGASLESVDNMSQLVKGQVVALEHLSRYDDATTLLTQYLETYPGDTDAEKELTFLQTR